LALSSLELEVNERTADLRTVNEQLRNEIEERKQIETELLIAKADAESAINKRYGR
jgi:C4-dicarboxylate-specific signal transduction histidine kinase